MIHCRITITIGATERCRTFEWKEPADGPFLSQVNWRNLNGSHPTFPYTLKPFVCDFAVGSLKGGVFTATFRTQDEDGWATAFSLPEGVVGDIVHYLISLRTSPPVMMGSASHVEVFVQMGLRWAAKNVGLLPVVMKTNDLEDVTLGEAVVRQALSRLPQTSNHQAFADEVISLLEKRQAFLIALIAKDDDITSIRERLAMLKYTYGTILVL